MPTILIVKTSSLGDVVHCLPAVSDIVRHLPGARVEWLVEDAFAAIPPMHPAVTRTIPCAVRRWRRSPLAAGTREGVARLRQELAARPYDAIVDAQGLLKSALLARLASGPRFGLDWKSSREPLALFYDRVFSIPRALHAVERNRRLCAAALGYALEGPPDYGIAAPPFAAPWVPAGPYAVLLHGTSRDDKLWPEERWVELGMRLAAEGTAAVLVWGSAAEHERARRLAAAIPNACVAPRAGIDALAGLLAGARAVVGVDTGLTHLAAALGVPVVGVYGVTDPTRTGISARGAAENLGGREGMPAADEVHAALVRLGAAQ